MFDLTRLDDLVDFERSPEYKQTLTLLQPYVNKIIADEGFDFYENFSTLTQAQSSYETKFYFTAGLRLGAQITAALLQQPPKTTLP